MYIECSSMQQDIGANGQSWTTMVRKSQSWTAMEEIQGSGVGQNSLHFAEVEVAAAPDVIAANQNRPVLNQAQPPPRDSANYSHNPAAAPASRNARVSSGSPAVAGIT